MRSTLDHVLVVGIAGGIGDTQVGQVLRPSAAIDRSSGTRYDATSLEGELDGIVSSSDEFLVDPERVAALVVDGVRALDMETSAVAAVCTARGVPWSAVRVISDLSSDHPDASVLDLAHPDGTPNARAAIPFLLRNPKRIPGLLKLGRDSMRGREGGGDRGRPPAPHVVLRVLGDGDPGCPARRITVGSPHTEPGGPHERAPAAAARRRRDEPCDRPRLGCRDGQRLTV